MQLANDQAIKPGLPNWAYLVILLLALGPRLGLWFAGPYQDVDRALRGDSSRYLTLASNLKEYHSFGLKSPDGLVHKRIERFQEETRTLPPADDHGLRPELFRTPGYPVFLYVLGLFTSDLRAVLLLQCLLGAICSILTVQIALAYGLPRMGAILAGILWSVHPALILYDNLLLTESLFNNTLILGLWLGIRFPSTPGIALGGLTIGVAGLIRPLALLYLPLAWFLGWKLCPKRWVSLALVTVMAVLPALGWAARNEAVGNGFRLTTVGDVNLVYYLAAYAISEEKGEDWLASWPRRVDEISDKVKTQLRPGKDVSSAMRRVGYQELLARPIAVIKVLVKSFIKLLVDHSLHDMAMVLAIPYQSTGLFSLLLGNPDQIGGINWTAVGLALAWSGFNILLLLAALIGSIRGFRRGLRGLVFACLLTLFGFMVATGAVGLERMRLPMFLPMILLVGCSVPSRYWGLTSGKDLQKPITHDQKPRAMA